MLKMNESVVEKVQGATVTDDGSEGDIFHMYPASATLMVRLNRQCSP